MDKFVVSFVETLIQVGVAAWIVRGRIKPGEDEAHALIVILLCLILFNLIYQQNKSKEK